MAGCRVIWWITDIIQSSDILFPHKTHSQRLESPQKNFTHFYGTSWWAQLPTFWEQKLDQQFLAFDGITENVTCPKQSSWLVDVARLTPKLHLFIDLTLRLDGTTAPLDTPVLLWRCSRSSMTLHGPRKLQTCAGRPPEQVHSVVLICSSLTLKLLTCYLQSSSSSSSVFSCNQSSFCQLVNRCHNQAPPELYHQPERVQSWTFFQTANQKKCKWCQNCFPAEDMNVVALAKAAIHHHYHFHFITITRSV